MDTDMDKDLMVVNGINILVIILHPLLLLGKVGRSSNNSGIRCLLMSSSIIRIWAHQGWVMVLS